MTVKTKGLKDRRALRFESIDELVREVDRLADLERRGKLRRSGNWTTGQIFGHLAKWVNNYYQDPVPINVPLVFRLVGPMMKSWFLRGPLPSGFKQPNQYKKTPEDPVYSLEEGYQRYKTQLTRIQRSEKMTPRNPVFGTMSQEDNTKVQLRHAELHLSFLHPME